MGEEEPEVSVETEEPMEHYWKVVAPDDRPAQEMSSSQAMARIVISLTQYWNAVGKTPEPVSFKLRPFVTDKAEDGWYLWVLNTPFRMEDENGCMIDQYRALGPIETVLEVAVNHICEEIQRVANQVDIDIVHAQAVVLNKQKIARDLKAVAYRMGVESKSFKPHQLVLTLADGIEIEPGVPVPTADADDEEIPF